jgi:tripartite-type tricarboxylate transporter receptor subunit TctC
MALMNRRHALGTLAAGVCGALAAPVMAQAAERFPARPITLWVPWPAGGATDVTMRLLAELAGRQLGQRVIVDNRAGAGGTLVMPILQQAAPDGYTIAQLPQPVLRAPHLQKVLWDPIRDTTPILQISGVTFGVVVPGGSALKTLDDVFAWAKAHPGELTVSTNGVGTTPHVVFDELFAKRGLAYVHVPYKGTSEQMLAVSSGQVMVGINSNGFAPFVDSGRLRLLVTASSARNAGRRCRR